ncbi:MAG: Na/Pi cotransporter family protein [Bacillales bacterium]|nr:Na/Pi cotransporter family protein [Bacillales bacterium]
MIITCILALLTGVGVFIAGMNMLSHALESACGEGVKRILDKVSNNRILGVGIGAGVTAIIQSSSATTVMVIGLVNAGIITLFQATSIIMGANIGTTITGIIASFSSFKLSQYISILAFIGVMMMFFKKSIIKNIGQIFTGIGLIFIGLELMSSAFNNQEVITYFMDIISKVNFPLLLILIGIAFTALIQSSSAMTGIVIVLAGGGILSIESSLFIILGTNIGTCVTALISSIGTSENAKRASLIHLMFNVIGTLIFTIILLIFKNPIINLFDSINIAIEFKIALFHVVFNVSTSILLLPFIKWLVFLSQLIIKNRSIKRNNVLKYIDSHLLVTPLIASNQVKKEIINMYNLSINNLNDAFQLINGKKSDIDKILKTEEDIDYINNEIAKYLVDLSSQAPIEIEKNIGAYFHVINDIERIGDHAINIVKMYKEMEREQLAFSQTAKEELNVMFSNVIEMAKISINIFEFDNRAALPYLDKLEEKTDNMKEEMAKKHFSRVIADACKIELTSCYTTIISNIERVGDHLVNIGYSIINLLGNQEMEKI